MNTKQHPRSMPRRGFEALDPAELGGLSDVQRDAIAGVIVAEGPALMRRAAADRLAGMAARAGALAAAAALIVVVGSPAADTKISIHALAVATRAETDEPSTLRAEPAPSIRRGAQEEAVPTRAARTSQEQDRATGATLRNVSLASSTNIDAVQGEVVTRTLEGEDHGGAGAEASLQAAQGAGRAPTRRALPRTRASLRGANAEARSDVSAAALLAQAETLWRKGDRRAARQAFREAARDRGPSGEAAWVRLARLELSSGSYEGALMALRSRKARADEGLLDAEALWLEVQSLERAGRSDQAVQTAETLLRDYPSSPQAPAARRLVTEARQP